MIASLTFVDLRIPFTTVFTHASAARVETETVIIVASDHDGLTGHGEGCPRAYVTGETMTSARAFFDRYASVLTREISDLQTLRAWVETHRADIDRNPAAWCAIELALLDLLGRARGLALEPLLDQPSLPAAFHYTAVLDDAGPTAFAALTRRYAQAGFSDFKIKLSGDPARDADKVATITSQDIADVRLRVDANNLWTDVDAAVQHLGRLGSRLVAVEEPLAAGRYDDLRRLSAALAVPVILDESLTRADQLDTIASSGNWIVNVRVSKMGGVLRCLELVSRARRYGIPVIVGAQVGETSLLTRAALTVAAAAQPVMAMEGAVGTHLLSRDVCDPSLMFGAAGVLATADYPALTQPGLGIPVTLPS